MYTMLTVCYEAVKFTSLTNKILNYQIYQMSTLNTNNISSISLTALKAEWKWRSGWRTGGLMRLLAVAQMKQTDITQWGQRAQYLVIARHSTLLPPAAGGETQTVDTHLARQGDRWLLALFAMMRTGQYEYPHSQMASHQGHCPVSHPTAAPLAQRHSPFSFPFYRHFFFLSVQLHDLSP